MSGPILRLGTDELLTVVRKLDLLEVVVEQLLRHRDAPGNTLPKDAYGPAGEHVVFRDERTGTRCAVPAAGLRAYRTAALTALAARQLLVPGVVTASVIGSGPVADLLIPVIVRHVPDVSHITLCPVGGPVADSVQPMLAEELEQAGIGLSVTPRMEEAVFGASLIALSGADPAGLRSGHVASGAVVVNASGQDLPEGLLHGVRRVFVDDLERLRSAGERRFVRVHHAEAGIHPSEQRGRVDSDLRQILRGERPGRTGLDHILLVELLGTDALDRTLAQRIHRTALLHGLGTFRPS